MLRTFLRMLWLKLQDLLKAPAQPGQFTIRTGEPIMAVNVFIMLPQGDAPQDIVKGELTVTHTVGGETFTQTVDTTFGQVEAGPFPSDFDDTAMEVSLVYVDDAGLKSEPRAASFSIDMTPPTTPGEMSFRVEQTPE